jgi:restriction system protein
MYADGQRGRFGMAIPDYETFMLPMLRMFAAGAQNVNDCLPQLIEQFAITPEEARELIPSKRLTVLQSRAHWARTFLGKAGLLQSPRRNVHIITDRGRDLLAENPQRVDYKLLMRYPEFAEWRRISIEGKSSETESNEGSPSVSQVAQAAPPAQSPDEVLDQAFSQINSALASELLEEVTKITPQRFEGLILDLLLKMGYGKGETGAGRLTKNSADGGIDGIIFEDSLGLDAVYIQAKKYAPGNNVSRPDIQRFVGSLTGEGATKGVFVTTSDFSREARDYLHRVQHRIVLINGQKLAELMIDHEVGVRARQVYVLRSIDENYFIAE